MLCSPISAFPLASPPPPLPQPHGTRWSFHCPMALPFPKAAEAEPRGGVRPDFLHSAAWTAARRVLLWLGGPRLPGAG